MPTKKIIPFIKTVVFAIVLSLSGCSSESELTENTDQKGAVMLHKNYEFLRSRESLFKVITNSETQKSTSKRTVQALDFKIFTDRLTYVKNDKKAKESFTFYIERNNYSPASNTIENLILTKRFNEEEYKAYIITYFFPDGIASEHKNFKVTGFKAVNSETFSFNNLTSKSACENTYEYTVIETAHKCYSGNHSGASEAANCEGKGSLPYSTYQIVAYQIASCGESMGGGGMGGDQSGAGGGSSSTPGSGGSGPVDTGISLPPSCQSVDCEVPILANDINVLLGNKLNFEQLTFLFNNDNIANEVKNYLDQNTNAVAKALTTQIIGAMVANPDLKINFTASVNSPMNIDKSAITNATTEGKKFNEIYDDALMKSPEFKKLFIDMFGESNRFNVKFQIGSISSGAGGTTDTNLLNPTTNIITIDPNFIKNNSKLIVAKTILHECIHAFLNVKLCDAGSGMAIPNINNMEFYNIVNQKYNGFTATQNQHDFIYNNMIPTMKTVLSEIKNILVSSLDNAEIIQTTLRPMYPDPLPAVPFSWNDCFHNISLSGLNDCDFFKNEIGTIKKNASTGEITITNTIDKIKMNNYNQYLIICQTTLH